MDRVMILGAEKPVVIFSESSCCISHAIEELIRRYGAHPSVHNLDELQDGKEIEKALVALGCTKPSVPAVFIGKKFIGGSNEVMSLHLRGELKPLLMKAKAIWL